jgi:hypothetical protein
MLFHILTSATLALIAFYIPYSFQKQQHSTLPIKTSTLLCCRERLNWYLYSNQQYPDALPLYTSSGSICKDSFDTTHGRNRNAITG